MVDYEYRVMTFGAAVSKEDTRRALVEAAEHGRWELARTRLYWGGVQRSWLRRRVLRVPRAHVDAARG